MKKIDKIFVFGALLALCLSGCSKGEPEAAPSGDGPVRLQIVPAVGEMRTKVSAGDAGYRFDAGDAVGVFAFHSGSVPVSSDKTFNRSFSYDGASWSPEGEVYWPSGAVGTPCCLLAYYPYREELTEAEKVSFRVSADQSSTERMMENDFLAGRTLADKADRPVEMVLSHLFCMITVNVDYLSEHIDDAACTVYLNARTEASIDLTQRQASVAGTPERIVPVSLEQASDGYDRSWSAIVPPQQAETSEPFLHIVYGNREIPLPIDKTFEAGCHYSVNVKVGLDGELSLEGIYVSQWDDQVTIENGGKSDLTVYNTGDVITYQKGSVPHPVTLVVTGDGFVREHLVKGGYFEQQAREALDFLFDVEPYKSYREYFNVYIIAAVSKDEGVGDDRTGVKKDTYFGISVEDSFSGSIFHKGRDFITRFVNDYCPDVKEGLVTRKDVSVALLANDGRRGGKTTSYSTGEGYSIIPLTEGEWVNDIDHIREQIGEDIGVSVERWPNVFLHEFGGHCIGRLGDEYWTEDGNYNSSYISFHNWTVPMCKNLTADISAASTTLFWKHMIGDERFPKVGVYEGGHASYSRGIWRPEKVSCMIDDRRYFNAYSRQLIVERIKSLSGEVFDYNDFLAKDVDYDEILDRKGSGSYSDDYSKYSRRDLPVYPLRDAPIFIDEE